MRCVGAILTCAALLLAGGAGAQEERLALVVGADLGRAEDEPLRFAESDARRVHELLMELGGVPADHALLLVGQGPERVRHGLNELRGRAAELNRLGRRVVLIFYYSGHGDEESLHLQGESLNLSELRAEMARIPADLRLVILDACRSAGRPKGVRSGPTFSVAAAPEAPHGSVEVRSSSAGEAAQESDQMAGAIFTHFLLSGLRGAADQDGDGRVTLSELYAYAYRRTLLRTGGSALLQHPSAVIDLRGAGEVVLSTLAAASASLEMPGGADRYQVFSLPDSAVVAELSGDGPTLLGLPAGRFLVMRQSGGQASAATVSLPWGGHRRLEDSSFRAISREQLVTRGGRMELHDLRLQATAGVELSPGATQRGALRSGVLISQSRGLLELELEIAFVTGGASTASLTGSERALSLVPALGRRFFYGPATVVASLGVDLRTTWQRLDRPDAARLGAAGLPTSESRTFGSAGPRAGVRLSLPLTGDATASLALTGGAQARREADSAGNDHLSLHSIFGAMLGAGVNF